MITPNQCRAARGLIDISQTKLSEIAGVSLRTVCHFEKGNRTPVPAILAAIQHALEYAGIEFTEDGGVRPAPHRVCAGIEEPKLGKKRQKKEKKKDK